MERRPTQRGAADCTRRDRVAGAVAGATLLVAAVFALAPTVLAADPSSTATPSATASTESSPALPEGLTIEARALLGGHARAGGWLAVAVDLANAGPPISGELRITAGPSGRVTFARAVDLPTDSRKREVLYVQAPSFGQRLQLTFVRGNEPVARTPIEVAVHDTSQLLVGLVAERRPPIVAALRDLAVGPSGAPAIVTLAPADLPERVEAWSALDRLVWQDVDTSTLSPGQLAALRAWLVGGGRLVVLGGTGGLGAVARFADDILPYRPTVTIDAPTEALRNLLGATPNGSTVPTLAGPLLRGRALVRVGDEVVVGEAPYGAGAVTLVGFDPTVPPIADLPEMASFWNRLLPARSAGALNLVDDGQLVAALTALPALALPPIGGLLALLGGYIVLVGPLNYLVLRRLDRREWAWITMPLLIVGFAAAAYAYGAALRGSDLIVNEVAIAAGAAGTTDGRAQTYVGVFSPSRGTYELSLPGGPLVAAPLSEMFGVAGADGTRLDVLQGDPARVRNLSIGYGTLRSIRLEAPTSVPLVEADLRLVDGVLSGSITNRSATRLLAPAVVLGASAITLPDLPPGETTRVRLPINQGTFGSSLADRVVGAYPAVDPAQMNDAARERSVRYQIVSQLTSDPFNGYSGFWLPSDGPVLLAWDRAPLAPIEIAGTEPRRLGTTLYYLTLPVRIEGHVVFGADLLRSTVLASDSAFFGKDPTSFNFGQGSLTVAYRTIPLPGRLTATRLLVGFNVGPEIVAETGGATEVAPLGPAKPLEPCPDQTCPSAPPDGLPELAVFDVVRGEWMALPHLASGGPVAIREPERYVDPATASVVFRFQNPRVDPVGFGFAVQIEGRIE